MWLWVKQAIKDHDPIGTLPWGWYHPDDQERVKAEFGLVLLGSPPRAQTFRLHPEHYGDGWLITVVWYRTGCDGCPIAAVSHVYNEIANSLTARERQIAKLIPELGSKQIAAKLKITISTVDSLRQRLATRVGMHGPRLIAWCSDMRDFL